ncbi:MAG: ABC transporter ATP-binding protein [Acidobacteria bacterium]|nr:ABC transporter ATP-binding protein [Acidobacteriota bacterium]
MNSLVETENLCKSFRSGSQRLEILTGLCLTVEKGEMVAVTGASGSGKSTLLHLLGGMDRPDEGSVKILGREITELAPLELSRFRNETVGFVFQSQHLLPEFTALENVMMPLLLRNTDRREAAAAAEKLLADAGLAQRNHHRPGQLSGGEQQRVALARALVGAPILLLADEPTGNLDPKTGLAIGELMRTLHTRHALTSVVVTHNEKLAQTCSRIYRLENGALT